MSNDNNLIEYDMVLENDNTLKQFFDRFYIIPKDIKIDERILNAIKEKSINPLDLKVKKGANGYIVFRKPHKKLNLEQQEEIKKEVKLSQRKLAKKYNCSVATINKILNNKY